MYADKAWMIMCIKARTFENIFKIQFGMVSLLYVSYGRTRSSGKDLEFAFL